MALKVVNNELKNVPNETKVKRMEKKVKEAKKNMKDESVVTWGADAKIEITGQEYQLLINLRDLANMLCYTINQRMLDSGTAKTMKKSDYEKMVAEQKAQAEKPIEVVKVPEPQTEEVTS